jgi:hypothetical protein
VCFEHVYYSWIWLNAALPITVHEGGIFTKMDCSFAAVVGLLFFLHAHLQLHFGDTWAIHATAFGKLRYDIDRA